MTNEYKIFSFSHSEGAEILAANSAKEAVMYYFCDYMDDLNTDDLVSSGLRIVELTNTAITNKHFIFNEDTGTREEVSYDELAKEDYKGVPVVLVTPNY